MLRIVLGTDNRQLAPEPKELIEQTDKIETGLPLEDAILQSAEKRKPLLEDFIFFAAAQREADRDEDGPL